MELRHVIGFHLAVARGSGVRTDTSWDRLGKAKRRASQLV